jgi:hypothetical protein
MAGEKDDEAGRDPPRQTYMPKPPSKEEVDQVSREQGMIADDWTGEPSAAEGGPAGGGAEGSEGGSSRGEGGAA